MAVKLDLTSRGLFPKIENATTDPKCVVISEMIQQLAKENPDVSGVTQSILQEHAIKHYVYLSQEERLSLPDADTKARFLYEKGVAAATAHRYYSFRLSKEDAASWVIVLV